MNKKLRIAKMILKVVAGHVIGIGGAFIGIAIMQGMIRVGIDLIHS